MRSQAAALKPLFSPGIKDELGDLRFRALMSEADWAALPFSIRRRFSKRLAGGNTAVYVGEVIETQMSRAGSLSERLASRNRAFSGGENRARGPHSKARVSPSPSSPCGNSHILSQRPPAGRCASKTCAPPGDALPGSRICPWRAASR